MNDSLKVAKNEFKKFFNGKFFIFEFILITGLCCLAITAYEDMANIAVNNLPRSETYSNELKNCLLNIDCLNFSRLFLTDFIYKGYFSFYILFVVLIAANIFSNDRENGNMKFTLLTGINIKYMYMGKYLFMFGVSTITVLFHLFISILVGKIFFHGALLNIELLEILGLSFFAVLPAMAISVIISLISQTKLSYKLVIGTGIVITITFGMLDTLSSSRKFSPIGALSIYNESIPVINNEWIICIFVSLLYIIIGMSLLFSFSHKYEYYE